MCSPHPDLFKHTCCEQSTPLLAGRPSSCTRPLAVLLNPLAVPRDRLRQPMLAWDVSPASRRPVMLPPRSRRVPPDSDPELPADAAEAAASSREAPAGVADYISPQDRHLFVHSHARARTARQQGIKLKALLRSGQARADQAAHLSHCSLPRRGAVPLVHGLQRRKHC